MWAGVFIEFVPAAFDRLTVAVECFLVVVGLLGPATLALFVDKPRGSFVVYSDSKLAKTSTLNMTAATSVIG